MPTTYPTELKVKTIRRYEKGESIKALSQELHISQSTLYQWRKEYCSIKTPTRTYILAEFDAISRRLQKLEYQMEVVRKLGYISGVCPYRKSWPSLRRFIIDLTILSVFTSGIRVGKKRISAIMQELGLSSVRVDAKKQFKR